MKINLYRALTAFAVSSATSVSLAQEDRPAGLLPTSKATEGATNVAVEGFESAEKPADAQDATELTLSAGGLLASGNSRSLALTAAANAKLRRLAHQLRSAASANYGQSATERDAPMRTNVENYQGRLRYDYFVSRRVSLFVGSSARHDRFQGLDLRLNIDPGLAYYFVDEPKHHFWGEVGYDYQFDIRDEEIVAAEGIDRRQSRHHARLFVGYDNKVNEAVSFVMGIEYLQGLSPYRDEVTDQVNWQVNSDFGLTSRISERFSVAVHLNVRYDNNPLQDLARTDVLTSANLVYDLF